MESQAKNRIHLIAGHLGNEAEIFNNQTSGILFSFIHNLLLIYLLID